MTYTLRPADATRDYAAIHAALRKFEQHALAYPEAYEWHGRHDFDVAIGNILLAIDRGEGWVVDGYLVMAVATTPWYNDSTVLREWLTLKLYPGGDLRAVPWALRQIAYQLGADVVFSGDSSHTRQMAGAFLEAGHKQCSVSLYEILK